MVHVFMCVCTYARSPHPNSNSTTAGHQSHRPYSRRTCIPVDEKIISAGIRGGAGEARWSCRGHSVIPQILGLRLQGG